METEINIKNEIAKLKDYSFFNRAMFLFENNKYVNSIFINEINDREFSDFSNCENIIFDTINTCITIGELSNSGVYSSSLIKSFSDEESSCNNFFLVADDDMPIGTDIIYKIVCDNGDIVNITPNQNIPLELISGEETKTFRLRVELKSNGINKPKINSIAIMYFDSLVNTKLNLSEPNIEGTGLMPSDPGHVHNNYVLKEVGKALSSNDYTNNDKDKLESLYNYEHPATHQASMIVFSDNKTFQQKLEDGTLKGDTGLQGLQGPKGDMGESGTIIDTSQIATKLELQDAKDIFNSSLEQNKNNVSRLEKTWNGTNATFCIIDDDGKKEVMTVLKPIFDSYNIKFSFCVVTSRIGTSSVYMNYDEIKQLISEGHTILSHTHNHLDLNTLDATNIEFEMSESKRILNSNGISVDYIAYPYGGINQNVVDLCRKYYLSGLTTETGVNLPPIMTQAMFRKSIGTWGDQNWDTVKSYIDSVISKKGLGVLTTHIADFTESDISLLKQAIEYIQSKGVNIVAYNDWFPKNKNVVEQGVFNLSLKKYPFAIGTNGYVDGTSINAMINLPINEITNGSSINHKSLKQNAVNITLIQNSMAGGLPKTSAGILYTHMYENPFQEFKLLYTNEWYIRRWNTTTTSWTIWEPKDRSKIISTDSSIFQKTPSDFEKGVISYNEVNTANSVESPDPNRAGMLITNKICGGSREYWYQEYQPINRNETYKRYATSDTAWSSWGKLTFV